MNVRGSLSRREVERFLEETTVPIRIACQTPAGHLWMVSVWFQLEPAVPAEDGDDEWILECATAVSSKLATYLSEPTEVAFEVSTNQPPYAGVRGRATATTEPDPEKETLRELLERYLDGTDSRLARNLLREEREEVVITIDPAVVYGWDFSDRMTARE
ncbi:pyridoxamine 5'-phosphate oxidase family protein [Natrarchaeobius chitinivorans]|uniref:Pyridoxamine 5'-phosphate oxidase family protein n=1 Tax=Natrarchaeobius chitinivorans TaxID=1679083 RepID=A0A3N6MMM9_NATCH|nr:pyridoxamine 5'-phosphate oxidase family protein [Natrarchaeobius chitinivorans]RQG97341.1 pyridoxamine 5'-phosphate oxidase family protein [Natrarchaeobius chitinivorans]